MSKKPQKPQKTKNEELKDFTILKIENLKSEILKEFLKLAEIEIKISADKMRDAIGQFWINRLNHKIKIPGWDCNGIPLQGNSREKRFQDDLGGFKARKSPPGRGEAKNNK